MPEYRVVGGRAVFGVAPGETFVADLSEFDEERLIGGGHIARLNDKAIPADTEKEPIDG